MPKPTAEPRIPPPRQIVQIAAITPVTSSDRVFALCNDGTVWHLSLHGSASRWIPMPLIPQTGRQMTMPQITEWTEVFNPNNTVTVTRWSVLSGKTHTMTIPATKEQFERWRSGGLIQECFPWASAEQREFIMTGSTQEEWDAVYEDEDDG